MNNTSSYYQAPYEVPTVRKSLNKQEKIAAKRQTLYLLDTTPMDLYQVERVVGLREGQINYWTNSDPVYRKEFIAACERNKKPLPSWDVFTTGSGWAERQNPAKSAQSKPQLHAPEPAPAQYHQPLANYAKQQEPQAHIPAQSEFSYIRTELRLLKEVVLQMSEVLEKMELANKMPRRQYVKKGPGYSKSRFKYCYMSHYKWFALVPRPQSEGGQSIKIGPYETEEAVAMARDTYFKQKGMPVPADGSNLIKAADVKE